MAKFIIKNNDSFGIKNFEIVEGKVLCDGDNLSLEYESKLGYCKVWYRKNRVIVERIGEVSSTIDINLETITDFYYTTEELRQKFKIKAMNIARDSVKKILSFSYKILDNEIEINEITISIKYN